jgi:hypothetical protein
MRMKLFMICALILSNVALCFSQPAESSVGGPGATQVKAQNSGSASTLYPNSGAVYYSYRTVGGAKVNVVQADLSSGQWQLKPVVNPGLSTTSSAAHKSNASAAVNGGYFDLTTGASLSTVVIDGKPVKAPREMSLVKKKDHLAAYRQAIANRSELRVLIGPDGKQSAQIAFHNDAVASGYQLLHSLQGGPQLVPSLTTKEEAFIRTNSNGYRIDVIRSTDRAARTAFGIRADGQVVLVAVEGPENGGGSPGVSLAGLAQIMRDLDCASAVNLDGGHSTAMYVKLGSPNGGRTVCGGRNQAAVKTVLVLVPAGKQ